MQSTACDTALDAWIDALGRDHVLTDLHSIKSYSCDVGGQTRSIPAVLRPADAQQVIRLVEIANTHRVPLYPISCGRNWGLGSKLPVADHCAIVDLSRMNRILEVNVAQCYAIIEPGVTQGQLYDHLRDNNFPLWMNVTGSGRDTSLIGNALDRGVGYFGSRCGSLTGIEAILGSGRFIRTGFGHYENAASTHLYAPGVGPSLDGLLAQSNYCIVTRAGFRLMPKSEHHMAVITHLRPDVSLGAFVEEIGALCKEDTIRSSVHMANRERADITLAPLVYKSIAHRNGGTHETVLRKTQAVMAQAGGSPWSAVCGVMSTRDVARAIRDRVRKRLERIAKVQFMTDIKLERASKILSALSMTGIGKNKAIMLEAIKPLYGLTKGIPTDAALHSVSWPLRQRVSQTLHSDDLDMGADGIRYSLPMIPLDASAAEEVTSLATRLFSEHGFKPHITLNTIDARALECVISLAFDRTVPEEAGRADDCIRQMNASCISKGWIPYRVGIQTMDQIIDAQDPFWQTVKDLKQTLDPNGIIAPGRYNLL